MKTVKPKKSGLTVKRARRDVYTVNVSRMEKYLAQTRGTFKDQLKQAETTPEEFGGALAGPAACSHPAK